MNRDFQYFVKELKRHYSLKFLLTYVIALTFLSIPLLLLHNHLSFDPVQFANIYLSSVFTALLIGLILQVIDLYKSTNAEYSRLHSVLTSLFDLLTTISKNIDNENISMSLYSELLRHYNVSLLSSFTADNMINEKILHVYKDGDLDYLCESFKLTGEISKTKKNEIRKRIGLLKNSIKNIIDNL